MFISMQTYEGLKITVNSIIEATQFHLQYQVKYVLTVRLCRDSLENYVDRKRSLGSSKDNSSMADFGYHDNATKSQKFLKPIVHGNVADTDMISLIEEPFPCRKNLKKN